MARQAGSVSIDASAVRPRIGRGEAGEAETAPRTPEPAPRWPVESPPTQTANERRPGPRTGAPLARAPRRGCDRVSPRPMVDMLLTQANDRRRMWLYPQTLRLRGGPSLLLL